MRRVTSLPAKQPRVWGSTDEQTKMLSENLGETIHGGHYLFAAVLPRPELDLAGIGAVAPISGPYLATREVEATGPAVYSPSRRPANERSAVKAAR